MKLNRTLVRQNMGSTQISQSITESPQQTPLLASLEDHGRQLSGPSDTKHTIDDVKIVFQK